MEKLGWKEVMDICSFPIVSLRKIISLQQNPNCFENSDEIFVGLLRVIAIHTSRLIEEINSYNSKFPSQSSEIYQIRKQIETKLTKIKASTIQLIQRAKQELGISQNICEKLEIRELLNDLIQTNLSVLQNIWKLTIYLSNKFSLPPQNITNDEIIDTFLQKAWELFIEVQHTLELTDEHVRLVKDNSISENFHSFLYQNIEQQITPRMEQLITMTTSKMKTYNSNLYRSFEMTVNKICSEFSSDLKNKSENISLYHINGFLSKHKGKIEDMIQNYSNSVLIPVEKKKTSSPRHKEGSTKGESRGNSDSNQNAFGKKNHRRSRQIDKDDVDVANTKTSKHRKRKSNIKLGQKENSISDSQSPLTSSQDSLKLDDSSEIIIIQNESLLNSDIDHNPKPESDLSTGEVNIVNNEENNIEEEKLESSEETSDFEDEENESKMSRQISNLIEIMEESDEDESDSSDDSDIDEKEDYNDINNDNNEVDVFILCDPIMEIEEQEEEEIIIKKTPSSLSITSSSPPKSEITLPSSIDDDNNNEGELKIPVPPPLPTTSSFGNNNRFQGSVVPQTGRRDHAGFLSNSRVTPTSPSSERDKQTESNPLQANYQVSRSNSDQPITSEGSELLSSSPESGGEEMNKIKRSPTPVKQQQLNRRSASVSKLSSMTNLDLIPSVSNLSSPLSASRKSNLSQSALSALPPVKNENAKSERLVRVLLENSSEFKELWIEKTEEEKTTFIVALTQKLNDLKDSNEDRSQNKSKITFNNAPTEEVHKIMMIRSVSDICRAVRIESLHLHLQKFSEYSLEIIRLSFNSITETLNPPTSDIKKLSKFPPINAEEKISDIQRYMNRLEMKVNHFFEQFSEILRKASYLFTSNLSITIQKLLEETTRFIEDQSTITFSFFVSNPYIIQSYSLLHNPNNPSGNLVNNSPSSNRSKQIDQTLTFMEIQRMMKYNIWNDCDSFRLSISSFSYILGSCGDSNLINSSLLLQLCSYAKNVVLTLANLIGRVNIYRELYSVHHGKIPAQKTLSKMPPKNSILSNLSNNIPLNNISISNITHSSHTSQIPKSSFSSYDLSSIPDPSNNNNNNNNNNSLNNSLNNSSGNEYSNNATTIHSTLKLYEGVNIWEEKDSKNQKYLWEDEDKLEKEKPIKLNELKATSVNKLVYLLTSERIQIDYQTNQLVKTFFITYRSFIAPIKLFNKLMERFDVPSKVIHDERRIYSIQSKVCSLILYWVESHFADFDEENLLKKAYHFCLQVQKFDASMTITRDISDLIISKVLFYLSFNC